MSDHGSGPDPEGSSSFSQSFKTAFAVLSTALHTRLELFVTELEEERERLKQTLTLTLLLVFGASFGLVLFTIFIVALFWEKGWIPAIGLLALAYFSVAVVAAVRLRSAILKRAGLFPATLAELGKDRDHFKASARE
ncbi:MAG: phage holin family protein [Chloroflexota bacterium]|jgi:uncharacterized membrane protein YqjE